MTVISGRRPNISRSQLTFQERLLLADHDAIVLTGGRTAFGEPFYVYIKTTPEGMQQMRDDYADGAIVNFYSYGEIILYGPGKEPPADVQDQIAKEFKPYNVQTMPN